MLKHAEWASLPLCSSLLPSAEVTLEAAPDVVVVFLQAWQCQSLGCWLENVPAFKKHCHRLAKALRLQLGGLAFFIGCVVRPVRHQSVVKAHTARQEALGLRVIDAFNQAEHFAHHIPVKPRWAERIFSDQPTRGEYCEVAVRGAGQFGL